MENNLLIEGGNTTPPSESSLNLEQNGTIERYRLKAKA